MTIARAIAECIGKPIAVSSARSGGDALWQTSSPPEIPSISGLTLRALWQASYGSETLLKDAVGNFDLAVNAGGPMELVYDAPSGRPAVYFDGTLELINNSLTQCGICLFFRPADDGINNRDAAGFGVSNANYFAMSIATESVYPVRNTSSLGNTAAPVNQWFCAFFGDDTDGAAMFVNIGGAVLLPGAAETRTGFSLGGRYPSGSTGTRLKGWLLGGCAFVMPDTANYVDLTTKMKGLMRHWFSVGAKPPSSKNLLIVSGDSIGAGYGLTHAKSPIGQLEASLSAFKVYGTAVNGFATASNIASDIDLADPSYSASRSRSVIVLIGEPSNQIAYGGTGAEALASVEAWATARKAAGFEVIVCTCIDRSGFDATMNTHKATYNTGIRNAFNVATSSAYVFNPAPSTTWADRMVDLHALNPTLFDGVHPSNAGATAIARAVQIAIESFDRAVEPQFSSPSKNFAIDQSILLTTDTPSASIYYTLDGSTPSTSSTLYTGPITVSSTTTIKAIAVKSGLPDSSVASATYTKVSSEAVALGWTTGTGTVSGNSISLGGFGENGYGTLEIDATKDFEVRVELTTAMGGMVVALDSEVGATTWGSGDAHYSGITVGFNFPAGTYDLQRVYSSGTASDIWEDFGPPKKCRIRKVDNDLLIDTSADGITWTNRDTRVGILEDIVTCRVKVYAISFGTIEAWLERLI